MYNFALLLVGFHMCGFAGGKEYQFRRFEIFLRIWGLPEAFSPRFSRLADLETLKCGNILSKDATENTPIVFLICYA